MEFFTDTNEYKFCNGTEWVVQGSCECDTNMWPDAFNFTDQTEVERSTTISSNAVTLADFDGPLTATCGTGCTAIAKNGTWGGTSVTGFMPSDTIAIRQSSSASYSTATTATVTVGKRTSGTWSVTTKPDCSVDPYWNNVSLMIDFENDGNPAAIADRSSYGHSVTRIGNLPSIEDGAGKYGDGGKFNSGGLQLPSHTGFSFGSGDFTIEFWIKPTNNNMVMSKRSGSGTYGAFTYQDGHAGTFKALHSSGSGWDLTVDSGANLSLNVWQHVAVTRSGNTFRVFVGGVQKGSSTYSSGITSSGTLVIGADTEGGGFTGHMDDVRITKGVARYTANFTPPGSFTYICQ